MEYFVYILWSATLQKFYIGQTQDLANRIREHNSGEGKYTSMGIPWTLVFNKSFESRSEAYQHEQKIKKRGARRFLSDIGISV